MGSIFSTTANTRPILPNSFRFLRSDVPNNLSQRDVQWLIEHNVTTVVDLWSDQERVKKTCSLAVHPLFQYHPMPVTRGDAVPESVETVHKTYIGMVDAQLERIVDLIWNAPSNVIYFCNAGKDRTGVVTAVLLHKAGMSDAYIIDDYMQSKTNLQSQLDAYAQQHPEINVDVITPHEEYMKKFLRWLKANPECKP